MTEAKAAFDMVCALAVHRIGKLQISEIALFVGVSARHREPAFLGCSYIIDQIKLRLPIWKKETYSDGSSQWIYGCKKVT